MRGNSDGGETRRRGAFVRWWLLGTLLMAVALSPLGCQERQPPAPAPAAREVSPSGPIDRLKAPAEVLLYGGADDLAGLARKLKGMLGPAAASVDVEGLAPALARELAIADPTALALDAPLRFALLDPGDGEQPWTWLIRVRSREALLAALPVAKTPLADHGGYSYPGLTKKPIYLSFIDDFAVFTSRKQQPASLRPFLVALAGAELGGQATVVVSVSHALALHGKDFEAAVSRARQAMTSGAAELPAGAGFDGMVGWIGSLAKGLEQLVVRLEAREEGVGIALDLRPLAGSELAQSFGRLSARKLELLAKIPADAALALAWSIDPEHPSELTRSLTSWSLQLGPEIDEDQVAAMNDYWKATSGQMAFAVHPAPDLEGLRVSGLVGIRDGEAARKAQSTLRSAYQRPAMAKLFEQVGVKIRFEPGAYRASGVAVDRISAELSPQTRVAAEHDLRELGRTAGIFTDLMNSHVAIGDELGVIAYGREGAPVIEAWLAGKMPGGLDQTAGLRRAQARAAPSAFMLLYAQPLTLARAWGLLPMSGAPAPEQGVALSVGSSDGGLSLLLDVPAEQASALATTLTALGRGGSGARR